MKLLETCELPVLEILDPKVPGREDEVTDEYEKLSKLLNYGVVDSAAWPLAKWLRFNEIPVYDPEKVDTWLHARAKEKDRHTLVTQPMRSKDKPQWSSTAVYAERIPVEVLRLAGEVEKAFTDKIRYEIMSIALLPEGDPFLRITHQDSQETFIVAHWDEPGFSILG